jgi:hypothetical protein
LNAKIFVFQRSSVKGSEIEKGVAAFQGRLSREREEITD